MVAPLVIAGGMAAFSAYNSWKAGQEEQELANEQASLLDLSAERVLEINEFNTEQTQKDSRATQAGKSTGAAARGVAVDLNQMAAIAANAFDEVQINTEEAEFKSRQLKLEAKQLRRSGKASAKAGTVQAVTTIGSFAATSQK